MCPTVNQVQHTMAKNKKAADKTIVMAVPMALVVKKANVPGPFALPLVATGLGTGGGRGDGTTGSAPVAVGVALASSPKTVQTFKSIKAAPLAT